MSNRKVIWTKPALNDLDDIITYIATDSVVLAISQYKRIRESTIKIEEFPEQVRVIPELENENIIKFREIIVKPWRVMYRPEGKDILILAIIDCRRNVEDILMRRQLRQ